MFRTYSNVSIVNFELVIAGLVEMLRAVPLWPLLLDYVNIKIHF